MKTAIMVIKANSDKASLKDLTFQSSQITVFCLKNDLNLVDCVISFTGGKDFFKQMKRIDVKKRFDYVIIYSPRQIVKTQAEYDEFVDMVRDFKAEVLCLRA